MKIFIVDKDPSLAAAISNSLQTAGYSNVEHTSTCEAAIQGIVTKGGVDLLVTDVIMEGMDGFALRESLEGIFPALKTILLSEYDLSEYEERIAGAPVFYKPFEQDSLVDYIKSWCPLPVPVPVATPTVSFTPTPTPTPTPKPKPKPVAASVPKPAVVATPVASSAVKAQVSATAKPASAQHAVPVKAAATAVSVSATPAVKPHTPARIPAQAAAPARPAPAAKAGASAKAPSAPVFPELELPADALVGTKVGDYQVEAKIGTTAFAGVYRAHQSKMNRKVRFYALDTRANPPAQQIEKFRQDAVAKAKVKQPFILGVYEAGEADGVLFYSTEYLPGRTLEQVAESGQKLDGPTILSILRTATDALQYLAKSGIPHNQLTGKSIILTGPTQVRLANIATAEGTSETQTSNGPQVLGTLLSPLVAADADQAVPGVSDLLNRLASGDLALSHWDSLMQAVIALTPKSRIADADKLEAKETARRQALEAAKIKQRKSVILTGITSFALLAVGFSVLYWALFLRGSSYKTFDAMIEIPAGPFIYQEGESIDLPRFWIAEHPVTIGQYAEFLTWLRNNPDRIAEVLHPDAPTGKNFIPEDWADSESIDNMPGYYTRARRWGKHRGVPLDLNSPVFGVDFYDAWGYAKWKGMRLPTEQEWEKAARGTDGFQFPWGNEPRPEWVNSGADFNANPEMGGEKDGWKRWNPVDAMRRDRSTFGVMGMAGNVSEWTDSWDESPHLGMKVPVIRGGNYQNPDYSLTRRLLLRMAIQNDEVLGFRIASSVAPDQVKPLE